MTRYLWPAPLGVLLLLAAGYCGAGGGDKKSALTMPDYYPLQVGNQWKYRLDVNGKEVTMTTKIAKIETIDQQKLARLEAAVDGNTSATEHLQQTDKGIFRFRTNGIESSPPLLLLKYPAKNGDKWSGAFTASDSKATYSCEAMEEEVVVPAGKYKTIRVAIKLEEKGQVVNTTYWFAKDVGFVKQTVDAPGLNILIELQQFDPKK